MMRVENTLENYAYYVQKTRSEKCKKKFYQNQDYVL